MAKKVMADMGRAKPAAKKSATKKGAKKTGRR